jgi:hypothetical protein
MTNRIRRYKWRTIFGTLWTLWALAYVTTGGVAWPAEPEPRWRTLNTTAREALQAKDYTKVRATLIEMRPVIPGNPRIAYNLAAAEAMLGNREATPAAMAISHPGVNRRSSAACWSGSRIAGSR